MGIDPEKLYFVSKKEYLNNYHPDLKQACKEVQDARYDHFEKKRQDRINQAKEFRNDLIKKENDSKSNSKTNSKENKSYYSKEATSTAIQREKEKLELMKRQQIGEIRNIIDFELNIAELKRKNEEKMRIQNC